MRRWLKIKTCLKEVYFLHIIYKFLCSILCPVKREMIRFFKIILRKQFKNKYLIKENYVHKHELNWTRNHLKWKVLQEELNSLKINKNEFLLDVGCNQGNLSVLLARAGYKIKAIDFNKDAIEYARENAKKYGVQNSIEFVKCSVDGMPFIKDGIRFAFMFDILEHIYKEDQSKSLKKIREVLKPNGKLLILVPFGHAYDDGSQHVTFFRPNGLVELLKSYGFAIDYVKRERRGDEHTLAHDLIKMLATKI